MANNSSFLPDDYLEKRIAQRTNVICLTLFAVVMGGVIAAFFVTDRQRTEIRAQQDHVNADYVEAARRLDQLDELGKKKMKMKQKARIASVLVERVPRSVVLSQVINQMPATLSLMELELRTTVLRNTTRPKTAMEREKLKAKKKKKKNGRESDVDVPDTEVTLNLIGVAMTDVEVSEFMFALDRHPMFADHKLQYSEQTKVEKRLMRKFRIDVKIRRNIDLSDFEPTLVERGDSIDPMGRNMRISGSGLVPFSDGR